jgi:hypothetical protein
MRVAELPLIAFALRRQREDKTPAPPGASQQSKFLKATSQPLISH